MDLRTEMLKGQFDHYTSLLRVQTFIKQQKNEDLKLEVFKQMATTFNCIDRLKKLDVTINKLNNAPKLGRQARHQRDLLLVVKTDLVRQIGEFNKALENGTHCLTTDSELLSVAGDLERATYIFRKRVIKAALEKSKKSGVKCAENS